MSRAPTRAPKPGRGSGGARAFERRQRRERERVQRRRATLAGGRYRELPQLGALLRRVPVAAWICVAIAILNAVAWSIVTPPFEGRDEADHFAYTARLAETGQLPDREPGIRKLSSGEVAVTTGLRYGEVHFSSYQRSVASVAEQKRLEQLVDANYPLTNGPGAGEVSSEPPLFYMLQTIPYALGGANTLSKLQMMRLLDALFGGLTVLLVFFFLREVVPAVPWAATVGAICVALAPAVAFVNGSLNPDALLFMLSAAIFLVLARGFRRRLTIRLAICGGCAIAAGLLTYFSFLGVALGAVAGFVVLAVRDARGRGLGRSALKAPAIAIGIGVSPAVLDGLIKVTSGSSAFGAVSESSSAGGSLWNEISYIWQLYLPRLPGMTHYFAGMSTWREVWFDRSVGLYGWMDTMFPTWVDNVALLFAAAVAVLCACELMRRRDSVRARLPELASYALIALGTMAVIGAASYRGDALRHETAFGEPRYLLVLLPLFAAAIVLAVRGAGRRWVPVVGAAMIVLFLGHDIFSQLQAIARYYG